MSTFLTTNQRGLEVSLIATDGSRCDFNTGVTDPNGATWWVTLLEGWEAPAPRQKFVDRAGDHGALLTDSFFDKRALTLGGLVTVATIPSDPWSTQQRFWAAWNKLTGVVALNIVGDFGYTTLQVNEIPTPRYVLAKISGRPKHTVHPGYFEFSLPFICNDPHKYAVGGPGPGAGEVGTW